MSTLPKFLVGAVAAGAMAMVPTVSASAQSRYGQDRGVSAGDIIAGAVVLGGIAAVAGSLGRGGYDSRGDERYYRDGRYGYYNGDPRAAVEQCVNAANNDARRRGYRQAQVTQVRDVNDTNYGWKIKGNLQVDGNRGYYNRGGYSNTRYDDRGYSNSRYDDRGYDNNRRYNDRYGHAQDSGNFTCWIERGRVSRMDYSGIRGM